MSREITIDCMTRSKIIASCEGTTITLQVEAYERGYGSPDFVGDSSSLKVERDSLDDSIDPLSKQAWLALLQETLAARSITLVYEPSR